MNGRLGGWSGTAGSEDGEREEVRLSDNGWRHRWTNRRKRQELLKDGGRKLLQTVEAQLSVLTWWIWWESVGGRDLT